MAKITVKRRSAYERRDGKSALYAIINIDRRKVRVPVDIAVTESEWDPVKEKVRGRGKRAEDCNLIIDNVRAKISDILVRFRLTGRRLTKEAFLAAYALPCETTNFNEYARRHLHSLEDAYQPETMRHHKAALKKLAEYSPGLEIADITPEWLRTYAKYLRDELGNNPGTVRKNMSVIRMHYYAAIRDGKVTANPFQSYKLPAHCPAVIYLTEEELAALVRLYHSGRLIENEENVLRFFLFMTFTGMHISDARNLQIEQIFDGVIHYKRMKTRVAVSIPMSVPAAKLVSYYAGGRHRGPLFQSLPTDQAFNRIIKRVCAGVGINKAVSAKAGRHTFATIYIKKNPGDIATLSKLLGHTSLDTTMVYAHIVRDMKVAGISAFDGML